MSIRRAALSIAIAAATASAAFGGGTTIYVYSGATGANNGTSWGDAYTSLQPALAAAVAGDSIWIAVGTYKPDPSNRSASFSLREGVAIYGGFTGPATSVDERIPDPNPAVADPLTDTILSGEIGAPGTADNSYSVVIGRSLSSLTRLDGVTITGGSNETSTAQGGGIDLVSSSPVINRCAIIGNFSTAGGGAMVFNPSNPSFTNCYFGSNSAGIRGGGMYAYGNATLNVTGCTFSSNTGTSGAGAIACGIAGGTIADCTFTGNYGGSQGGALWLFFSSPTVNRCTFTANSTNYNDGGSGGGGIWMFTASPVIDACTFNLNVSRQGGALYPSQNSSPVVTNCLMHDNLAFGGGGMMSVSSTPTLINCTVVANNDDNHFAGGLFLTSAGTTLINCIVRDNVGTEISGTVNASYCNIQQTVAGTGNTNVDPLFVDAPNKNFRLQLTSPSIDAGNNAAVPLTITTDLAGQPRFRDIATIADTGAGTAPITDLGAYESAPPPPPVCVGDINNDGTVNTADLTALLARFGQSVTPGTNGDLNNDGTVNTTDLTLLLSRFGTVCT